jgi:hypothetical protein
LQAAAPQTGRLYMDLVTGCGIPMLRLALRCSNVSLNQAPSAR